MKDKVFHQVVRYAYAEQAVNELRTQKCHKILEVGAGAHANLAEHLPYDMITFLDIDLPEEVLKDSRFVLGDATNLLFEDDSFDFVIALDVIEHIPVAKRSLFIENINRVAKIGVVLSAPHFSAKSAHEDELLKCFYIINGSTPPVWIDEHIECTLPTQSEILRYVCEQKVPEANIISFFGVKRELMLKMLIMESVASKYTECLNFFDVVNTDYINCIMYQDKGMAEDEAMKTYVLWTKEQDIKSVREEYQKKFIDALQTVDTFEHKYTQLMNWVLNLTNSALLIDLNKRNEENVKIIYDKYDKVAKRVDEGVSLSNKIAERVDESYNAIRKITGDGIKLNVILITYNHEKFIRQTLETILMQQTSFSFNIIVADDCSDDGTLSIIKELEQVTDIPFIYLPNDHNLGIMQNYKRAFDACDAEYVAIMEGDDLWTDKLRLQKHVDFLDSHAECAMSFNRYVVKNFEEGTIVTQPRFSAAEEAQYFRYITGHDLAYDNLIGNFSTCVYRSGALKMLPEQMFSIKCYDWLTNIMVSKLGYIGCLIQTMSIYRIHSGGAWSGQSDNERLQSIIDAIDVYDEFTNREFTAGFSDHKARLQRTLHSVITQSETKNSLKSGIKVMLKKCYRISRYLPPIFIAIVKLIIPNAIKEKIIRNI